MTDGPNSNELDAAPWSTEPGVVYVRKAYARYRLARIIALALLLAIAITAVVFVVAAVSAGAQVDTAIRASATSSAGVNRANDKLRTAKAALADVEAQLAAANPLTGNPVVDYFTSSSNKVAAETSPQAYAVSSAEADVAEAVQARSFAKDSLTDSRTSASASLVVAFIAVICVLVAAVLAWITIRALKRKASRAAEYLSRDA